ncbi:UDP-N-acetylglucosamine 1-carboxyvinyltransferase [bacterium]|nr:UDP-N-acetylglucosamine 1-carboxyvinyltransferase [bacterium]
MAEITIEGQHPLHGTVKVSGSKHSAVRLIYAAMLTNEDVVLENVPHVNVVETAVKIVQSVGGTANWVGSNRLLLNGSTIQSFEIPVEVGSFHRYSFLLGAPLLARFGKARLPKLHHKTLVLEPINRLLETWESLGVKVEDTGDYYDLDGTNVKSAPVGFRVSTHIGTDNAILTAAIIPGETIISNASEETEIDDLLGFLDILGVSVERPEPRRIKVVGTDFFNGGNFTVQPDKTESATFATAAALTGGNIIVRGVKQATLTSFVNFLSKIGVRFDFSGDEWRVWSEIDEHPFAPADVTISPTPGFVPDWQPLAALLLTKAEGTSLIHDTVYLNRFDYIRDLNRMGAKIELTKPSQHGMVPVISDDSYNFENQGEPNTVLKIEGPTKLKGVKMHVSDPRFEHALILAALVAEGKSIISDCAPFEKFLDKLHNLGAHIWH